MFRRYPDDSEVIDDSTINNHVCTLQNSLTYSKLGNVGWYRTMASMGIGCNGVNNMQLSLIAKGMALLMIVAKLTGTSMVM